MSLDKSKCTKKNERVTLIGYQWPPRHKRIGNKFNAVKTYSGHASKLEGSVYQILKLREKAGGISDIEQQKGVDLGCGIKWKVDFSYYDEALRRRVWAEAKGVKGDRYRICLKLWRDHGPGPLEIYEGSYQRPILKEIVIPKKENQSGR